MAMLHRGRHVISTAFAVHDGTRTGPRPVFGGVPKIQEDPHRRDYILFYEYPHGDNGAGLGASHQTRRTGVVAQTVQLFAYPNPEQMLASNWRQLGYLERTSSSSTTRETQ